FDLLLHLTHAAARFVAYLDLDAREELFACLGCRQVGDPLEFALLAPAKRFGLLAEAFDLRVTVPGRLFAALEAVHLAGRVLLLPRKPLPGARRLGAPFADLRLQGIAEREVLLPGLDQELLLLGLCISEKPVGLLFRLDEGSAVRLLAARQQHRKQPGKHN